MTLLAITLFRYGHFFHHYFHQPIPKAYYALVTGGSWAFMSWYLALGVFLLKDYFKNNLFSRNYFDESQWGLICPMVSFAVLGSFVYKTLLPSNIVLDLVIGFLMLDLIIMSYLFIKQVKTIWKRSDSFIDTDTSNKVLNHEGSAVKA